MSPAWVCCWDWQRCWCCKRSGATAAAPTQFSCRVTMCGVSSPTPSESEQLKMKKGVVPFPETKQASCGWRRRWKGDTHGQDTVGGGSGAIAYQAAADRCRGEYRGRHC